MLGNGRLEARAFDDSGTMRLASIRGKLRKKVWYVSNSTVLLFFSHCCCVEDEVVKWRRGLIMSCRINTGDVILLSLREFQDGKGDVILKYSSEEARNLKAYGMFR